MRFDIRALALSCAILWGGATLVVALVNLFCGGYGQSFLEMLASCYPGYHAVRSIGQVAVVAVYACVDGLMGGVIFGCLYNRLQPRAS